MELLYHYLWKHRMLGRPLATCDGRPVEVLSPGVHNEGAGPDYSNSIVKIDGDIWAGNVEIHVKASDWFRHGHDKDLAYDSVILHVVAVDDARIRRKSNDEEIPQVRAVMPEKFFLTYAALCRDLKAVRCAGSIASLPRLVVEDWLETLSIERLHQKAERILEYYRSMEFDWEQVMFVASARALGFGLNGLPFEMLAKSVPLKYVYHHSDNLMQIEALLFGQAGMLDPSGNIFDEYYQRLCSEYAFMVAKYGLRPLRGDLWKYARTRPQNFPHRRIAMLARALYKGARFVDSLANAAGDPDALMEFFSWDLDGYWLNRSSFGSDGIMPETKSTMLSRASRELMLINVAAPFYYAYGHILGDCDFGEKGIDLLMKLKSERNTILTEWERCGLKASDASRSQALIHLRREYCDRSRCLDCRFGHYLLRTGSGGKVVLNTGFACSGAPI